MGYFKCTTECGNNVKINLDHLWQVNMKTLPQYRTLYNKISIYNHTHWILQSVYSEHVSDLFVQDQMARVQLYWEKHQGNAKRAAV